MRKRTSRLWKVSSEEFKKVAFSAKSYSDIANHFNYPKNSSVFNMIKERLEYEGIPLSIIDKAREEQKKEQLKLLHKENKFPLEKILVKNSTYNRTLLKSRLLNEGLIEEKCSKCGIGSEWNGEPLSLQLDHKNGINNDNRLENLRLLCPNCHSQTPTFCGKHKRTVNKCLECGKNIKKKSKRCNPCANKLNGSKMIGANNPACKVQNRPSRSELIYLILNHSFLQIGKKYGVSDNAIRKWCKFENLPHTKKTIEEQRAALEAEIKELIHN